MSRSSETDKRFEWYAQGEPDTADSIERGWRALHHEWAEAFNPLDAVRNRAVRAQATARVRSVRSGRSPR